MSNDLVEQTVSAQGFMPHGMRYLWQPGVLGLQVISDGLIALAYFSLDEDLISPKGIRLVPAGHEVTRTLLVRPTRIADGVGVAEPFRVRVPT